MDSERWKQVDRLLQSVLERPPEERDAFLRNACAADEQLEREVRSLLRAQKQAGSFLENPAIEGAALAIAQRQGEQVQEDNDFPADAYRIPLPHCGKAGQRRDGSGLQGRRH